MPSGFSIRLVSHDPYFDIEILLPPLINKIAPTFIGTVPCRLVEKDFDLVIIHDDLLHEIVNEHLGFKSQGLLIVLLISSADTRTAFLLRSMRI